MKQRQLLYSASYLPLAENHQHQFAQSQALRIYRSNSIYSFIPKNACTTMRLSLAIANGCIKSEADFKWIRHNSNTFTTDLPSLIQADYTFVILRCPFARVASAYLDKIVQMKPLALKLYNTINKAVEIENMSFRCFVNSITQANVLRSDTHWRPQTDFLVYEEYDDYFNLETFATAKSKIESNALIKIFDARKPYNHSLSHYALVNDGHFADTLPGTILAMMKSGQVPTPSALYDDELATKVYETYKDDIALYKSLFGDKNLMFS
ncbi:MAG: sulfotransferase family 2 domain-containing protein [Methylovulum sp.]|uniref:sulfotransferase family 2 domain-containing protein n=1 Tax=Methylovulum sp. TaxID=1916980 RepID=UPI00261E1B22|nr:sulfotransferase family 2 domain-containing protein [Methylovulum sp.]MDD2723161.1 sulfotransferase family 2 domain-containing protein [Methylovulum sp.]MDD5125620.1 sulfotransferase family 2 domain-containing protein [Methylovulum sp.]